MMTLWSIFRSPFMFGGELRDNDEWTHSLLTNREVIEVHQASSGARQVYREDDRVVWTATGHDNSVYVALYNIADEVQKVSLELESINISEENLHVRDLWNQKDIHDVKRSIEDDLRPHASTLYKITIKK